MALEGGCACGGVRYRLNRAPVFVQACHCTDCQRLTGSAFVINAWIERSEVEVTSGAPAHHALQGGSGTQHDVHFCPACATYLWSDYHGAVGSLFVRVGTLDDPRAIPPRAQIFTRSKQPWVVLPSDMPAFDGFYNPMEFLPEDSLARLAALRA